MTCFSHCLRVCVERGRHFRHEMAELDRALAALHEREGPALTAARRADLDAQRKRTLADMTTQFRADMAAVGASVADDPVAVLVAAAAASNAATAT